MGELWTTVATSGVCAVLLCAVLVGIYKIAISLIASITTMINNAIFHVTVDSKEDKKENKP